MLSYCLKCKNPKINPKISANSNGKNNDIIKVCYMWF